MDLCLHFRKAVFLIDDTLHSPQTTRHMLVVHLPTNSAHKSWRAVGGTNFVDTHLLMLPFVIELHRHFQQALKNKYDEAARRQEQMKVIGSPIYTLSSPINLLRKNDFQSITEKNVRHVLLSIENKY